MMTSLESLRRDLAKLKLNVMAANLDAIIEDTASKKRDAAYALKLLVALEAEARWKSSISRRFVDSKLVGQLSIDQFDWKHHHSREEHRGVMWPQRSPTGSFITRRSLSLEGQVAGENRNNQPV